MPVRIQRKRTKGWRMPENTVYVGRPSKWGNPYIPDPSNGYKTGAIERYEFYIQALIQLENESLRDYPTVCPTIIHDLEELRGKNLCCWCKTSNPCHADILLRLANE